MGHGFHGYVSHNQRVFFLQWNLGFSQAMMFLRWTSGPSCWRSSTPTGHDSLDTRGTTLLQRKTHCDPQMDEHKLFYILGYYHHLHVLQMHHVYMHMDLSFWLSTDMTLCNTAWHYMTSHDIHMTLHYITYIHGSVWTWGIHRYTCVSHQKFTMLIGEWSYNTYRFYLDKYMIILD